MLLLFSVQYRREIKMNKTQKLGYWEELLQTLIIAYDLSFLNTFLIYSEKSHLPNNYIM